MLESFDIIFSTNIFESLPELNLVCHWYLGKPHFSPVVKKNNFVVYKSVFLLKALAPRVSLSWVPARQALCIPWDLKNPPSCVGAEVGRMILVVPSLLHLLILTGFVILGTFSWSWDELGADGPSLLGTSRALGTGMLCLLGIKVSLPLGQDKL